MIGGGLSSDILTLLLLTIWTIKGRSWRLPLTLTFVYLMKLFCTATFRIQYPDNYLWAHPGFYSLTTPYGMSNDFHFTIHVALLTVVANEFFATRYFKLGIMTVLVLMF